MSSIANNGISVAIDQNEYLAEGADTVDAVVTVETGADFVAAGPEPDRLEVLIIDCSGSMATGKKFEGARRATLAALDVLKDGTRFAIIEGTSMARLTYPSDKPSVPVNRDTRAAARRALDKLRPNGGTAMGTWLGLTRQLAKKHPDAMVHAILLTDGKNEHEEPAALAAEIKQSDGIFTCDCRGVGTDWQVDELRAIASALHGTVDIVADPANLAADFAAMTQTSMAKAIPELTLRVWTPAGATVQFVKQVAPTIEDLTARRTDAGPQLGSTRSGRGVPRTVTITCRCGSSPPRRDGRNSRPGSVWSPATRWSARDWCARYGPPRPSSRPGSAGASRITPDRPNSPRSCRTG